MLVTYMYSALRHTAVCEMCSFSLKCVSRSIHWGVFLQKTSCWIGRDKERADPGMAGLGAPLPIDQTSVGAGYGCDEKQTASDTWRAVT